MSFWSLLGLASASDVQALCQELQNVQTANDQMHTQEMSAIQAATEAVSDVSNEISKVNTGLNDIPGVIQAGQREFQKDIMRRQSDLAEQISALHLGLASASDIQALRQELQNAQTANDQMHTQEMSAIRAATEAVSDVSNEISKVNTGLNDMPGIIQAGQREFQKDIMRRQSDLVEQISVLRQQLSEYTDLEQRNMDKLFLAIDAYQRSTQEKTSEYQTHLTAAETVLQRILAELEQGSETFDSMLGMQKQTLVSLKETMRTQKRSFSSLEETQRLITITLDAMKDYLNLLMEASKLSWVDELLDSLEDSIK